MEFMIKTEVWGAKWSLWHCAKFNRKFYPNCSLHLSSEYKEKKFWCFFTIMLSCSKGRKKHPFPPFLTQSIFVFYLFIKQNKPKTQNQNYREFVSGEGQLLVESLGMSSSFALESCPALPNPAQTWQSEVLPEWPAIAKMKSQPHTGDGLISNFFCPEDSFSCICVK